MHNKRPLGITIISVLIILNGIFLLFTGLATFLLMSTLTSNLENINQTFSSSQIQVGGNISSLSNKELKNLFENFDSFLYVIASVITLFSIIHFIIAFGLLTGKSWARTVTTIILVMEIIVNIMIPILILTLPNTVADISNTFIFVLGNVVSIAINSVIIYYLNRREVKNYFNYSKHKGSYDSSFYSSLDDLR